MKNLLLSIGLLASSYFSAQNFSKTYYHTELDMNHMNIEAIRSTGEYVIGGTTFEINNNDKTNMYLSLTDANGNIQWQLHSPSYWEESRLLDVTVDNDDNIIVVGYSKPNVTNHEMLTVLKFDLNGNLLASYFLDYSTSNRVSAGTNIIYSEANNQYIIGGFFANEMNYPLQTNNEALVLSLDKSLNHNWLTVISGPDKEHSSINDIIEVPEGYFITGTLDYYNPLSLSSTKIVGAVLACYISSSGNLTDALSFHRSNVYHRGVSAVFDEDLQNVFMVSTSSEMHNPILTRITLPSPSATILNHNVITLDTNAGEHNPAVFQMIKSTTNVENLILAGYTAAPFNSSATTWLVEINKYNALIMNSGLYEAPTDSFTMNHGGSLFSTFEVQDPYIFTQEILTRKAEEDQGVAFLAPRVPEQSLGGNYNFDLVTMNLNTPSSNLFCISTLERESDTITVNSVSTNHEYITPIRYRLEYIELIAPEVDEYTYCFFNQEESGRKKTFLSDLTEVTELTASPNPTSGLMKLYLEGDSFKSVAIYNSIGKLVKTITADYSNEGSINIDLSSEANGIYILMVEGYYSQKTIKISKQD